MRRSSGSQRAVVVAAWENSTKRVRRRGGGYFTSAQTFCCGVIERQPQVRKQAGAENGGRLLARQVVDDAERAVDVGESNAERIDALDVRADESEPREPDRAAGAGRTRDEPISAAPTAAGWADELRHQHDRAAGPGVEHRVGGLAVDRDGHGRRPARGLASENGAGALSSRRTDSDERSGAGGRRRAEVRPRVEDDFAARGNRR